MNIRTIATAALSLALAGPALAQTGQPTFATRKVDGTDNVYIYRYMGHQSMFVVTPKGVIATDPIARYRPEAATTYLAEIKKVTDQPVKYVIYSHAHYDHIAGAKPFKDQGARIVAHKNAKTRFEALKKAGALLDSVVMPDETVDTKKTITLGGTTLELHYVGRNHSDSSLVMRLPKEKLIFVVDFIPIEGVQFRNIPDNASPLEYEESIKKVAAMDFERMIPGHPGPGGRLGTKQDVQDLLTFLQDASAAVKTEAQAGKCWDAVEKELKLPKYESWPGYQANLPFVLRRYCGLWGRGT
jgi:glyoxylase-like metal-dependent hydrolase (beta-lactamase superfamily II)